MRTWEVRLSDFIGLENGVIHFLTLEAQVLIAVISKQP